MQEGKGLYATREEVEELLLKTRELADNKGRKPSNTVKKKTPAKKIVGRLVYGLLLLSLALMLGKIWMDRMNGRAPSLFGYQSYVVETGSMIPTLPIGSTILVRELKPGELPAVGDIITYSRESAAITHRITHEVTGEDGVTRYQTQGDNPDNSADPWLVSLSDIRGIVIWHVTLPWAGR